MSENTPTKQRTGVLLINLGTPDSPSVGDVRRYLAQFLRDPRVIDINPLARWLLLNLIILPFRPAKSAAAYKLIWSDTGSPLLTHGKELTQRVAAKLGDQYVVELGMRYASPPISGAVAKLLEHDLDRIIVLPLFPQYSSAATGSAIQEVLEVLGTKWTVPPVNVIGAFFDDAGFIDAFADVARAKLDELKPDFVLFSYHGLPERHVKKCDTTGQHCLMSAGCCDEIGVANRNCYRAQCMATTRALVASLELGEENHSTSFQSRLGRTPWIKPYTDVVLPELAKNGHKRLAVMCPAFVADCLETLEEIAIRARAQWIALGGEDLALIPSLNAHPAWADAVVNLVRVS